MRACSAASSPCIDETSASRCAHSDSRRDCTSLSARSFSIIAASLLSTPFHSSFSIFSRSPPSASAERSTSSASLPIAPPCSSIFE